LFVADPDCFSIDHATDSVIQRVIREEFESRTLIAVTHRPATVEDFDMVLSIEDGKFLATGSD
jgi:ABC-type multidrug transport system fused ATPase/permease subunit